MNNNEVENAEFEAFLISGARAIDGFQPLDVLSLHKTFERYSIMLACTESGTEVGLVEQHDPHTLVYQLFDSIQTLTPEVLAKSVEFMFGGCLCLVGIARHFANAILSDVLAPGEFNFVLIARVFVSPVYSIVGLVIVYQVGDAHRLLLFVNGHSNDGTMAGWLAAFGGRSDAVLDDVLGCIHDIVPDHLFDLCCSGSGSCVFSGVSFGSTVANLIAHEYRARISNLTLCTVATSAALSNEHWGELCDCKHITSISVTNDEPHFKDPLHRTPLDKFFSLDIFCDMQQQHSDTVDLRCETFANLHPDVARTLTELNQNMMVSHFLYFFGPQRWHCIG